HPRVRGRSAGAGARRPRHPRRLLRRGADARRGLRRGALAARRELPRARASMNVAELIRRKRDGASLAPEEIAALLRAYTDGALPDDQAAALLMAVYFRGLDEAELHAWTQAMLHSGDVVDLADVPGVKVDKHSTGGVGDMISLALAPLVASVGVVVPMISGR